MSLVRAPRLVRNTHTHIHTYTHTHAHTCTHTHTRSMAQTLTKNYRYHHDQSTDGVALLAATISHLDARRSECPRTVVATHFHELTLKVRCKSETDSQKKIRRKGSSRRKSREIRLIHTQNQDSLTKAGNIIQQRPKYVLLQSDVRTYFCRMMCCLPTIVWRSSRCK